MKCLLIFFICLGLTSAQHDDWYKECRAGSRPKITDFKCGIKAPQDRIFQGTEAERNSIPWIAQVLINPPGWDTILRQGAIIGPYHVLTIAALFSSGYGYSSVDQITVRVNKHFRDEKGLQFEEGEVHHKVECLSVYPGFDRMTKNYAILILKEPIMSYLATPVCLPAKQNNGNYPTFEGEEMTVSGWGYTSKDSNRKTFSNVLKQAKVRGFSHHECKAQVNKPVHMMGYPMEQKVDEFMICAVSIDGEPCKNDYGAPLTFDNSTHHVLAGLASFNLWCNRGKPAVYSSVTRVIDWIKQHGLYTGRPTCPK